MKIIDIREESSGIVERIVFAYEADKNVITERDDIVVRLSGHEHKHNKHIFLECSNSEYLALRRADVGNLIKSLQKAQEIWAGCK